MHDIRRFTAGGGGQHFLPVCAPGSDFFLELDVGMLFHEKLLHLALLFNLEPPVGQAEFDGF